MHVFFVYVRELNCVHGTYTDTSVHVIFQAVNGTIMRRYYSFVDFKINSDLLTLKEFGGPMVYCSPKQKCTKLVWLDYTFNFFYTQLRNTSENVTFSLYIKVIQSSFITLYLLFMLKEYCILEVLQKNIKNSISWKFWLTSCEITISFKVFLAMSAQKESNQLPIMSLFNLHLQAWKSKLDWSFNKSNTEIV